MVDPEFVAESTPQTMESFCRNGHEFVDKWPMPMTLTQFAARMKEASTCRTCGAPTFLGRPAQPSLILGGPGA